MYAADDADDDGHRTAFRIAEKKCAPRRASRRFSSRLVASRRVASAPSLRPTRRRRISRSSPRLITCHLARALRASSSSSSVARRYKLHREQTFRTDAKGRRRGRLARLVTRPVDLDDVVDLRDASSSSALVRRVSDDDGVTEYFTMPETHPGCVLVPNALDLDAQREWLRAAATTMHEPPARTNHGAARGSFSGLWDAAATGDRWLRDREAREGRSEGIEGSAGMEKETDAWETLDPPPTKGDPRCATSASHLLRKLRWATVGAPYDWTARRYDLSAPRRDAPDFVLTRCRELARLAGHPAFAGDAGLVNYYRSGDALAGHVDDAERDLAKARSPSHWFPYDPVGVVNAVS
jgi:alkylated DNA repair protein alkB family protein 1